MKMKSGNIVFKVTKAHMKMNRKRTLVTFLGIFIMVVLMTAVFIGKDTVLEFMKKAVAEDNGKWHMQVYNVTGEQAERIAALRSVKTVDVSRSLGYTEFAQSADPGTPFLEIKAYSGNIFELMNIKLVEGRYPENDGEILISGRAVKDGADIKVGDVIDVETFDRYMHAYADEKDLASIAEGREPGFILFSSGFKIGHGETLLLPDHFPYYESNDEFEIIHKPAGFSKNMTVVGIMEQPFYERSGQGGYMALTCGDSAVAEDETVNLVIMEKLSLRNDAYEDVLRLLDEYRTEEEREALMESGSYRLTEDGEKLYIENGKVSVNEMILAFEAKSKDGSLNFLMIFVQAFFIILITVASLVLIYNVFSISYNERSRYLGMLSSVGATRRQKRQSVYYAVFSLLVYALPFGIITGIVGVKIAMMALYPHFNMLLNSIVTNAFTGKNYEVGYRIVVNPLNILFVVAFSAAAVWLSAWLPAKKISKVGPVESIRGNDGSVKSSSKGFRTGYGYMLKGKAEALLARASVRRNRYSTKGIIRSISAFIILTLVTAFLVRSFSDILTAKTEKEMVTLGKEFKGMEYCFDILEEEQYAKAVSDIEHSDEIKKYKKLTYDIYRYRLPMEEHSAEYRETLETVIRKYYPEGYPEWVTTAILEPDNILAYPYAAIMVMSDEDYKTVADKAGIKITDEYSVLAFDSVNIDTDQFSHSFEGAATPGFASYAVKEPLKAKKGEKIELCAPAFDEETEGCRTLSSSITLAGYVNNSDIEDFFTLRGEYVWLIMSEKTMANLDKEFADGADLGIVSSMMFFSVVSEDAGILGDLSQMVNSYGDKVLVSASFFTGTEDLKDAVVTMARIVSVCFTLLIGVICLLNLYNSVTGRRLARKRELAVLDSMGITGKQRSRMLLTENVLLLLKSFIYSGVITTAFVVCLHKILNDRFGRMIFTLPLWIIILTAAVSITGLFVFTALCYGKRSGKQLIEEVRSEIA